MIDVVVFRTLYNFLLEVLLLTNSYVEKKSQKKKKRKKKEKNYATHKSGITVLNGTQGSGHLD